jgi:hypothetical protein
MHEVVHVEDADGVCAWLQVVVVHSEELFPIHIVPGPVQCRSKVHYLVANSDMQ